MELYPVLPPSRDPLTNSIPLRKPFPFIHAIVQSHSQSDGDPDARVSNPP